MLIEGMSSLLNYHWGVPQSISHIQFDDFAERLKGQNGKRLLRRHTQDCFGAVYSRQPGKATSAYLYLYTNLLNPQEHEGCNEGSGHCSPAKAIIESNRQGEEPDG